MIVIITALRTEAEPFIRKYALKQKKNSPFLSFYNDDITVIISGMNPYNAAIATSYALSALQREPQAVVNFGICGSYHKKDNIGDAYQVKKIVDASSRKVYHLQNQKKLFQTADITTFHTPQNSPQKNKVHLVDMESSGFYMAAGKFIGKEKIYIFKIVSDYGETAIPDAEKVISMTEAYSSVIEQL